MGKPASFSRLQGDPATAIHFDRPRSAALSIPTTLLHPIFGKFLDDCENLQVKAEDNALVMELSQGMSGFFDNETGRATKFQEILRKHGIELQATKIDPYEDFADGDMRFRGFRYAIVKDEIVSAAAEPHAQAIWHYHYSTARFAHQNSGFRFPCILISLFGKFAVLCIPLSADHYFHRTPH